MEEAEAGGTVPAILCDVAARSTMRQRMADLADDDRASDTLNAFAKVSNYAGSTHFLFNHVLHQFPDARFIFTHRPPRDILASMAKFFLVFTCISVRPGVPGLTPTPVNEPAASFQSSIPA